MMKKKDIANKVQQQIHQDYVDTLIERVGTDTSGRWISREAAYEIVRLALDDWLYLDPAELERVEKELENSLRIGD